MESTQYAGSKHEEEEGVSLKVLDILRRMFENQRFSKVFLLEPGDTVTDGFSAKASSNLDNGNWNVKNIQIFNDVHCYHPHTSQGGGYDKAEVTLYPLTPDLLIKGVVVRGRRDADQYSKEGDIFGSTDGVNFEHLGRMKFCDNNRDKKYIYFRKPGRYSAIRIRPTNYHVVPVLNVGLIV